MPKERDILEGLAGAQGIRRAPPSHWFARAGQKLGELATPAIEGLKGAIYGDPLDPEASTANLVGQFAGTLAGAPIGVKGVKGLWSRLSKAAETLPGTMHPNKALSYLGSRATKEEMDVRGLSNLLKGKGNTAVTRREIVEHLNQNPLDLQITQYPRDPSAATPSIDDLIGQDAPQYSKYTLPGGTGYRETLIKKPASAFQTLDLTEYTHPHWPDDPNVIAHTRSKERTLPTGERGRFLEEVQSDWHQEGKEKGYATPEELVEHADPNLGGGWDPYPRDPVPHGPFKESWPDLALKQQLLDVAEQPDLNWLGFTTGKTQAQRYDLSQTVDRIEYNPTTKVLEAWKSGSSTPSISQVDVTPDRLKDYIGMDAAQRVLATEAIPDPAAPGMVHALSGADLTVGGEGMQQFYDTILPNKLQKLLTPFGGSVEQGNVETVLPSIYLWSMETSPHQVYPSGALHGQIYRSSVDLPAGEHIASTWPPRQISRTADDFPIVGRQGRELADIIRQQQVPQQVPAWIARLSPEMKKAILEKGFPAMALYGLIGQGGATEP